jgi:4-hydroxybenzoate polyprenyltransferase
MDEVKDLAKDRIAHPERPLPRGLLTVREVERAIFLLMGALFLTGGGACFSRCNIGRRSAGRKSRLS